MFSKILSQFINKTDLGEKIVSNTIANICIDCHRIESESSLADLDLNICSRDREREAENQANRIN